MALKMLRKRKQPHLSVNLIDFKLKLVSGKGTISNTTALSWLKNERPKVAIYPHQTDYCDFCVIVKKEIQGHQQTINRLLQSGNATTEELQQCE